jgi:hypothetical protein
VFVITSVPLVKGVSYRPWTNNPVSQGELRGAKAATQPAPGKPDSSVPLCSKMGFQNSVHLLKS